MFEDGLEHYCISLDVPSAFPVYGGPIQDPEAAYWDAADQESMWAGTPYGDARRAFLAGLIDYLKELWAKAYVEAYA